MSEEEKVQRACPVCSKGIESSARKCPHCHSRTNRIVRWLIAFRHIAEFVALIAAVVVLYFMYESNEMTRIALNLTEDSLNRLDSSLVLTRQQLEIQREQNESTRASLKLDEVKTKTLKTEMEEKNRPRMEVTSPDADSLRGKFVLFLTFENMGVANADQVIGFVKIRSLPDLADSVVVAIDYETISKDRGIVQMTPLSDGNWQSFLVRTAFSYKWKLEGKRFDFDKSLLFEWNEKDNNYAVSVLTKEQAGKYWTK
ncbi:MAG: hypothetical protein L0Y74_10115 [candidate division Zixibacteria bacterium]|nr:hypothetical protein [candidate division Zixibacteria bacterium]